MTAKRQNPYQRIVDLREALGGRRFLLSVGCGVITSFLCAMGVLSESVYATVILGTVGAFISGATVQRIKTGE